MTQPTTDHISMVLSADEEFPGALEELTVVELHVLHSMICCQLDQEYLTSPAGAHPTTLDRRQDLVAELYRRQRSPTADPIRR